MKILDLLENSTLVSYSEQDLHNYKTKLEKKLSFMLDLKRSNQWQKLSAYELEQNALTRLLTMARKFREDDGIDSKIIRDFVHTFNIDTIQMIRGIE